MITSDQPTIFPENVTVRVSSVSDGTMSLRSLPENPDEVWQTREKFIAASGGDIAKTKLVYITYNDTRRYDEYKLADTVGAKLSAIPDEVADGLATNHVAQGLFLPIADCCAVVLYDTKHHALMLSHIGRHSVEQYGALKSLAFMKAEFGTESRDVLVWLSPAVGGSSYPILKRDSRSLKECIVEDFRESGVPAENIEVSQIDTAQNPEYFSHSQYKKGTRKSDGRFAVYAQLTAKNQ